jgi:hypothetical protein
MEETPTSAAGDHTDSGAEAEQAKATRSCNILAEEDAEAISVTPEQACKLYSPEQPDLWHRTPTLHHQQRRRAKPRRKEETTNPIYNYTTIPRLPSPTGPSVVAGEEGSRRNHRQKTLPLAFTFFA